jgi:hypothetical protein
MAVLPSADSATEVPCRGFPTAGVPEIDFKSRGLLGLKRNAELTPGAPVRKVMPLEVTATEKPCIVLGTPVSTNIPLLNAYHTPLLRP